MQAGRFKIRTYPQLYIYLLSFIACFDGMDDGENLRSFPKLRSCRSQDRDLVVENYAEVVGRVCVAVLVEVGVAETEPEALESSFG